MAYVNLYYAPWASENVSGYLYIDQLDYSGGASELLLDANSIFVSYNFEDWNIPIVGMQCEFSIRNTKTDFFELLPLLSAEEREFRVRIVTVSPTIYTIFEGFINCDTITQKFLHRQSIRFVASSHLSKLENDHPVSIDTLQNKTFIDIIDEILVSTGASYNIRVNCKIHAEGDILQTGQTLFNKNGFYTELFWEDDVERTTSLEILKAILTTFDCYIYWWRGYWYIERYEDIWTEDIDFVEYATGTTYDPTEAGSVVNEDKVVSDLHALVFTDQSQTLSIIPGLKTVKVTLEDKRVFNLIKNELSQALNTGDNEPAPPYRTWMKWTEAGLGWISLGLPYKNISNSVQRVLTQPNTTIPNHRGLYTSFKVTVDNEDTQLNIKFKYSIENNQMNTYTKSEFKFFFHWYLRFADETNLYITKSGDDLWNRTEGTDESVCLQEVKVSGDSFDFETRSVEVSITVPLGKVRTYDSGLDIGPLRGDHFLVLCVGLETINWNDVPALQPQFAWLGDFNITTTGDIQDNVIEGKVAEAKFLNKKDISLALYDMESYSYKNGVLRGDTLTIRTERWGVLNTTNHIVSRGVCWNTTGTPTIANSKTTDGTGFGTFTSLLTGLSPNTLYYARAYATDADGTTSYGNEITFTTEQIAIGQYHQGGRVFYLLQPGEHLHAAEGIIDYDPNVPHGLIASVADQTINDTYWGIYYGSLSGGSPYSPGAFYYEIGEGLICSNLMHANTRCTDQAVKLCLDYVYDGYSDWFLPSIEELRQLRKQRDLVDGFREEWYWSSSEVSPSYNYKWSQAVAFHRIGGPYDPATAYYVNKMKNSLCLVRAIRYF